MVRALGLLGVDLLDKPLDIFAGEGGGEIEGFHPAVT